MISQTVAATHSTPTDTVPPHLHALIIAEQVDSVLLYAFNRCGYKTDTAKQQGAMGKISQTSYDLICVEVSPDDERGFELISHLRSLNPEGHIITLTKDNQKLVETRARKLKVSYHMVSPYSMEETTSILSYLASHLGGKNE
jgi:DNA-binding response OmpR family regulator